MRWAQLPLSFSMAVVAGANVLAIQAAQHFLFSAAEP